MGYLDSAKNVLELEAKAILRCAEALDEQKVNSLCEIYEFIKDLGGSLIFCGVGKSGIIGMKLASTFSSLGLSSYFLHPTEALHGDLGRIGKSDAIVFISKSGTTEEILKLIPFLNINKNLMIGLLGNNNSAIAEHCGIVFDCSVEKEACINNQAPTTSSTVALAMGDAMAVVYEKLIGLSKEGFAENHPGGILGKSLRLKVRDLMVGPESCPSGHKDHSLQEIILSMTRFPVGACAILDDDGKLEGLVVEGDIRRTFNKVGAKGLESKALEIFNPSPVSIGPDRLAHEALKLMEKREKEIDILPVVGEENVFLGFIRLHDLWKEGFR